MSRLTKDLESLIDGFHPQSELDEPKVVRARRLIETRRDICSRAHFAPGHFTASAFVLAPDRKGVLLIFHKKLQRWLQPGGHIEETDICIESAARREVLEETGLEVKVEYNGCYDIDIHRIPAFGGEPSHEHFDLRFLFRAMSLDAVVGDGVTDTRWFPIELFPLSGDDGKNEVVSDESVMRVVKRLACRTK